jgi:hypothetical protein
VYFSDALSVAKAQRYPYTEEEPKPWLREISMELLGVAEAVLISRMRALNG